VANAFALEYLNAKSIQRLSEAVLAATWELAQRSAIYGENHPSFVRAAADLEAARQRLHAAINRPVTSDVVAGEGVNLAEPSSAPSSPNGVVILGLALIGALAFGMGLAVWLDRQDIGQVPPGTAGQCLGHPALMPEPVTTAFQEGGTGTGGYSDAPRQDLLPRNPGEPGRRFGAVLLGHLRLEGAGARGWEPGIR
jgi:hypothetical protein